MRIVRATAFALLLIVATARACAPARHVVLVVWDGMRPDFITEANTPALWKLAHDGVWFRNHHSIYPTATDVNGAALATGCYPNRNGLLANGVYRPEIEVRLPVDSGDPATIKRGDEVTNGKYLEVPTFVEQLRAAGKRVALCGTKSVALLFDRHSEWSIAGASNRPLTIFAGAPLPSSLRDEFARVAGAFRTEASATSEERNAFTTRALTDFFWRDAVSEFSLLWLSEPDLAQHDHAPGSPEAIEGLRRSDENLGKVMRTLDERHVRDSTDVLVVSDHGFSTIRRSFDVIAMLQAAGFHADKEFPKGLKRGDVMVAGNGGSCLFYIGERDEPTTRRLIEWLQHSDFAGVIFSRLQTEGTFDLATIKLDHPTAADVVVSFRWADEKNQFGAMGVIDGDWNRKEGQGTHATLSRVDVNNTFVAAGPHFRKASEETLPTSNVDIAPTILAMFGMKPTTQMDGRVLSQEAGAEGKWSGVSEKQKTLESSRIFKDGHWRQELSISEVRGATYFDEGNGAYEKK